uniref:Uncharacterized protein n=1 Tax=Arcella intermedia TaxID=1963864 RepID=A0A6B2LKN3_9EUKA
MLGSPGVGKSSMKIRFVLNQFIENYDPPIEDNYVKQVKIDGTLFMVEVLDPTGGEECSPMRDYCVNSSFGSLIIYSIDSKRSLDEVNFYRELILRIKDLDQFPIVLCGNRCDLESRRECSTEEGRDLAILWGTPFFETSATVGTNVEESFFALVREINQWNSVKSAPTQKKRGGGCQIL